MEDKTKSIGEKLRVIRMEQGVTINKLAKQTNLTPSFISQFERGITKASVASIQKITQALNTSLGSLFENGYEFKPNNDITLIRKENRRQLTFPKPENTKDYLLTGLEGKLQVIYSKIEPGGGSGKQYTHKSEEECIVILTGKMKLSIEEKEYILYEGDSITFCSRQLHGWKNIGECTLEAMWIMTPPTF